MNERQAAQQLGAYLDQLVRPGAATSPAETPAGLDPGLLATVDRLAALPRYLPQPTEALDQQVWQQVRAAQREQQLEQNRAAWPARLRFNLRWLAPLAAVLLVIVLVLPGPRTALGNWMARFRLGDLQVVVAPEETVQPQLTAKSQAFVGISDAEQAAGFQILQPSRLPAGYHLAGVAAVSYAELPRWLQPLYVESRYEPDQRDRSVNYYAVLRQYNARRADGFHLDKIEYQSEDVSAARGVTLPGGEPGVLIEIRGQQADGTPLMRELVWQRDGGTMELRSQVLSEDEMLDIAESLK